MNDSKIILSVENLEKTYKSAGENLTIFKNLSMQIFRGEQCVILGKSGSGKSTLLNIIGGIDRATGGKILVDGKNLSEMNERQIVNFRKNFLGLIFQFHYLLKDFTALENVMLPALIKGVQKKSAAEKAMELIRAVGMENRASHFPAELSGGERQRIAVARSLVNDPQLILADEPTGNLDPANAESIGELLFSLSKKFGKTLILVTHDMNLASRGQVKFSIENGMLSEAAK
jgi:lipoprotein-releasing system ATP-binding protein